MARNQKLSYKMNMFHFLTKQNYSKYSQISMSVPFSSSEASTMFRSSTASSTSESVIFSKGLSLFLSSRTDNCDFSCWRPAWQGSFGLKQWILLYFTTCVSSYTGIIKIDQDLILSQAWVNCDFLAFLGGGVYSRGGVYFKLRDFRGRLFEAERLFEEIR